MKVQANIEIQYEINRDDLMAEAEVIWEEGYIESLLRTSAVQLTIQEGWDEDDERP